MKTRCDKGDKYVLLANTDSGAKPLEVLCDGLSANLHRYLFTAFDEINVIALKNPRIGFAFPLQSDKFQIIRFDLDGAPTAVKTMRAAAEERMYRRTRGTRDEKL